MDLVIGKLLLFLIEMIMNGLYLENSKLVRVGLYWEIVGDLDKGRLENGMF